MEHFKSTFAVTGIAVLGLMAAAGILHPGNFERQARPAAESLTAAAPTAWVDPPASRGASLRQAAPLSDMAALLKPEPAVAPSADSTMVRPLPAKLVPATPIARNARASQRSRAARRPVTTRQAALVRPASDEASTAQQSSGADSSGRKIDPIGDLMRGLGLTDRS